MEEEGEEERRGREEGDSSMQVLWGGSSSM